MLSFLCCTAPHQELPTLIEIADSERRVTEEDLLKLCSVSPVGEHRIYHNETGWVIYCEGDNCGEIIQSLCTQWPGIAITCYRDPFYQFQRSAHCGETEGVPGNWDHVIMRANLVEDEKMQEEYMNYHQNQFDEWPEVSQGFCHAGFQQLLLFRSGIPSHESDCGRSPSLGRLRGIGRCRWLWERSPRRDRVARQAISDDAKLI